MATIYKNSQVLGTTGTSTYETLYNTSGSTTAVISTIAVCNRSSADKRYRIAITSSESTPGTSNFIVYDSIASLNDTTFITVGIALSNNQYIRVSSEDTNITFSAFVSEIS